MRSMDMTGRTLRLRRETLRRLSLRDGDLRRIAGGSGYSDTGGYDPGDVPTLSPSWTDSATYSTNSRFC